MKRLDEVGLDAADHKCTRSETSIKWCGKNYSQGEIKHDPEGLAGLATMRGPETAGKLMQFLQAVMAAHVFAANGGGRLASSCVPGGAYGGRQATK